MKPEGTDKYKLEVQFIGSFNLLASRIHETAVEKGWWDQQSPEEWLKENFHGLDFGYTGTAEKHQYTYQDMLRAFESGKENPPRNESELLMLTVSELAEGMEGLRKDLDSDHIPGFKMIEEELADAIIRIADYAKKYEYRVAEAVIEKMKFNKTRSHKHGGKKF